MEEAILIFINKKKRDINDLIKQCKTLFNKTTNPMIGSENQLGQKHYKNGFPYSPKLKEAATKVIQARK